MGVTVERDEPVAFLSYAHVDDEHDGGGITAFRKALEGEVRVQTGRRDVRIFQDREDIAWGRAWKERIDSSLGSVTFLVPVLTPSFFSSDQCRRELRRFLDRERRLGRRDLVLPVYWVSATPIEDPARCAEDDLAQELAARQFTDWRELRFKQLADEGSRRALAGLATHLRDVIDPAPGRRHTAARRQRATKADFVLAVPAGKTGRTRPQVPAVIPDPALRPADPPHVSPGVPIVGRGSEGFEGTEVGYSADGSEAVAGAPAPVCVGRGSEMGLLTTFVRQAAGGRGAAVLVEGEPGIGKTTPAGC
jgi:hypothetical protein